MITLQLVGQRIYFVDLPYAKKDRAAGLGATWDAERRQWWIGAVKRPSAEALVAELNASDGQEDKGEQPSADPHSVRITAKAIYKCRTYYVAGSSRDGKRTRLVSLPKDGKYLDFWADTALVEIAKSYPTRSVGRGRYQRQVHQTLGSLADFIAQQRSGQSDRRGRCSECDAWGTHGDVCQECHEGTHL